MKTGAIKTLIFGTLLAGMTSCQKGVFRETSAPFLAKESKVVLDSVARESRKILENPVYRCYAMDTVRVPQHLKNELGIFQRRLTINSLAKIPHSPSGKTKTKDPNSVISHLINPADYEHPKAVIDNSKLFTPNGMDTYVPVKYYGIPVQK